jgi:hypothetical protein
MLAAWLFWILPAWAMLPANASAERLLETLETPE